MSTAAQLVSSGGLVAESVAQTKPQAEISVERGFRVLGFVEDEWGRSESIDPDNVGDIADEGMGHRG